MVYKAIISALGLWCVVYTVSYGCFELKRKNPAGGVAVLVLGALTAALTVGFVFVVM